MMTPGSLSQGRQALEQKGLHKHYLPQAAQIGLLKRFSARLVHSVDSG